MSMDLGIADLPWLSTPQMVEVDRAMIEDYRIDLVQMMENAGRNLARLARRRFLEGDPRDRAVIVLAGGGGNGGGALVAARHLANWGARVSVVLGQGAREMTPVATHQLGILGRMGLSVITDGSLPEAAPAIILDGLIGYSLKGAPFGRIAALIRWANAQDVPILSLDVPSGLDADVGTIFDPAIRATATMTLALPKRGLLAPGVAALVGELYLADIGVPPALYARTPLNLAVAPIFAEDEILRIGPRPTSPSP
jgi:NAD(P)H-hydrate epimerase